MTLGDRVRKTKCEWLPSFLKDRIRYKDLRTYNRTKILVYYFPYILESLSQRDFELALSCYRTSNISILDSDIEYRYKVFDVIYKEKNGVDFYTFEDHERRYITLEDLFKYFKV